jgi:galactose mutarotase-like enzyme
MSDITLMCGSTNARIALEGAELRQWRIDGQDLMWTADAQFWDRTAPILFPLCGWTRDGIRVEGKHYSLGLHGFAHASLFSCVAHGADYAHLRLRDDAHRRALYPFAFELSVYYQLRARELEIRLEVTNCGDTVMPYACGLHPGFVWPLPNAQETPHRVPTFEFRGARAESIAPVVPVIATGGLISSRQRPVPLRQGVLPLTSDLWAQEALCFFDVGVNEFCLADGASRLRIETENFPHCVLWRRPEAPFLCVESWTGFGDPEGFDGDIFAKPSMIHLPSQSHKSHRALYSVAM